MAREWLLVALRKQLQRRAAQPWGGSVSGSNGDGSVFLEHLLHTEFWRQMSQRLQQGTVCVRHH